MSETTSENAVQSAPVSAQSDIALPDQKKILMDRAKLMGLKVSPNIGVETLRARINEHLDGVKSVSKSSSVPPGMEEEDEREMTPTQKENAKRSRILKDAMKLVRVRITCLNPNKKDLPGEIFTIGNRYIGTVKKYVPFGDQTENGYHIPNCIYEHLKSRKFLQIRTKKASGNGESILVQTGDVPEFAIEVLPQLTREELRALAQRQAMANGTAANAE